MAAGRDGGMLPCVVADLSYSEGTAPEARRHLAGHFRFYNSQRQHQSLVYRPPAAVYGGRKPSRVHEEARRPLTRPPRLSLGR